MRCFAHVSCLSMLSCSVFIAFIFLDAVCGRTSHLDIKVTELWRRGLAGWGSRGKCRDEARMFPSDFPFLYLLEVAEPGKMWVWQHGKLQPEHGSGEGGPLFIVGHPPIDICTHCQDRCAWKPLTLDLWCPANISFHSTSHGTEPLNHPSKWPLLFPCCCLPCRSAFWGKHILSFDHPLCLAAPEMTSTHPQLVPSLLLWWELQWVTLLACHGHDSGPTDDPHLLLPPVMHSTWDQPLWRRFWLLPQEVKSQTPLVWGWNWDLLPGGCLSRGG